MKKWNGYQKGINLGGWLSQCCHTTEHYESFISEEDIRCISGWGLDHIRVPVDYNLLETKDGSYREDGFAYIQRIIDWCGKYHLNMILDLHKTAGYSFDSGEKETGFFDREEYQERFYRLWEELAKRYGGYEERLAFELLNEVVEKEVCEKWNQIADTCIRRIREIAPTISILVGGYWNNCVTAVKDLGMPQDEHIIYNFHCYEPLIFTHQGAEWTDGMPADFRFSLERSFREIVETTEQILPQQSDHFPKQLDPEQPLDKEFFIEFFAEAVKIAEERNVSLYCGEYGVIENAVPSDVLKWYQAIYQAFEYYGIGRAAWSYKSMNYGLIDGAKAEVFEDIKKFL